MAIRQIQTFHSPCLYQSCRPVIQVDDKIRLLLDDMVDTLHNTPQGCALAANQIGIRRRLVVIDFGHDLYRLVNPHIRSASGVQYELEGCLSFPGLWGKVRRPRTVVVTALDVFGNPLTLHASGLLARCLSHEIDHLDGIVFLTKVQETRYN